MILQTKHFGEIDIDENRILTFKEGLLGFEHIKQFTLILNENGDVPFHWLQAIEDTDIAFVITNPFFFKSDYAFDIPDKVKRGLEIEKEEDVLVFSICVVPEDIAQMTMNLRGPLIININQKKGQQIVLDGDEYSLKHHIFKKTITQATTTSNIG